MDTTEHVLTFDDWLVVLDALETDATTAQREAAQDTIQHRAPQAWLEAVEARDSRAEPETQLQP